ncbi:MAG: hypothetical protein AAFN92_21155, partial [Bacteroidota bacterium]
MRIITSCLAAVCTLLLSTGLVAQNLSPAALVERARAEKSFEERFDLFVTPKSTAPVRALAAVGADYHTFDLDPTQLADLRKSAPDRLELTLPGEVGRVALVRSDIFAPDFRITESGKPGYVKTPQGLHYRGVVADDKTSLVALSVYDTEVSGIVATKAGNLVLGKLTKGEGRHVLYND